jgi:hypothetical protein
VYFYELHEGDNDVFADLLLARETEMSPDVFFQTVQEIRRRVQDTFEQDTLIEAIAEELERDHGFIFISDARLTAAVNVSTEEADNFLADLDDEVDEVEFDGDDEETDGYLTIVADLKVEPEPRPN